MSKTERKKSEQSGSGRGPSAKKKFIELMDTTLRDGEQTHNVSFTPAEKLHIARILLEKVRVSRIEIASARVSQGELEAVKNITDWARSTDKSYIDRIEVLGFVDGGKSVEWISEAGGGNLNLLTKGSLKHLQGQLNKTPAQHFKEISKVVDKAGAAGVGVNVYLEDWSNGYRDSRDYVYEMIEFLNTTAVKRIMLPDTLGVLYPGEVHSALADLSEKFPETHFDFHPHNDYGLGTINVLEAIRGGAKGVHVTVNCLGERTGNASLAEVVANIHDHLKLKTEINEKSLFMLSRVVETFSGKRLAANAPIVGEDVFTQTAGIHADGDKKGGLYENPLLPRRFGRKRSYALGKLAGRASLEQNLKDLGIELSEENRNRVLKRIIELGDQKKTVTPEDIPFIVADVLKIPEEHHFKINDLVITTGKNLMPVCSIWLEYAGKEYRTTGSGDGGFDAFMNALKLWTEKLRLQMPSLLDYEVRIPPGGRTSALVECKITWDTGADESLTTRGVHSDQTLAAVQATQKMLNSVLKK